MQSWMARPTPVPIPARRLRPLDGSPWLRYLVWNKLTCWSMLLWLGGSLSLLMLAPVTPGWGVLLLVSVGVASVVALGLIFGTFAELVYQYCPECFSRMTRGARVCPFCHFRPSSHSQEGTHSGRSFS